MIKTLLVKELRRIADSIENGTCRLTESDALEIFDTVAHVSISKEEASTMLGLPASTFDKQVKNGKLPRPHKVKGITEKMWYRNEINR